ncbi:MAG: hypothetical protein Q4P23_11280 [Micrococcaceae bacterium]|nr:hypothetical protein [Micrococcaceae bacterium]
MDEESIEQTISAMGFPTDFTAFFQLNRLASWSPQRVKTSRSGSHESEMQ